MPLPLAKGRTGWALRSPPAQTSPCFHELGAEVTSTYMKTGQSSRHIPWENLQPNHRAGSYGTGEPHVEPALPQAEEPRPTITHGESPYLHVYTHVSILPALGYWKITGIWTVGIQQRMSPPAPRLI